MSSLQPAESPVESRQPFQFTLRGMLVAVAAVAAVLSLVNLVGFGWTVTLGLIVLMVAAHVVGNSLGTSLRDQHSAASPPRDSLPPASAAPHRGPQQLSERTRLCRLTVGLVTAICAATGAALGATTLAALPAAEISQSGLAIGTFSAGVIGGFGGFLLSSFTLILRRAWREAVIHRDPPVA